MYQTASAFDIPNGNWFPGIITSSPVMSIPSNGSLSQQSRELLSIPSQPKKTLSPEVASLIARVSEAATVLSQITQKYDMIDEEEHYNHLMASVEAFLEEIDSLMLCKIANQEKNIPTEVMLKIQELQRYAEEAFTYLIAKGRLEFIGSGTEGEAHRIRMSTKKGNSREFVVLKKSHLTENTRIRNEFHMQEHAHIIAGKTLGVDVPRPYMNFSKGNDHYMVMEYIPGKTLYTLQLEQVANKIVLERIVKKLSDPTLEEGIKIKVLEELKEFYTSSEDSDQDCATLSSPLYGFFTRHNQSNPILFENDTIAEERLMQLLQIAYQINAIEGDPLKKVLDPQFGIEVLELATKLYRENEKMFPLFTEKESTSAVRSLRAFFQELHKSQLYHRDFHPRNIIMGFDGNIRVIDFGYAIQNSPNPYSESGGGERIDDMNLVQYIGVQKPDKHTPKIDLLAPKLAKQQMALKNFNFVGLSEYTGISPKDLELAIALQNYTFSPSFLISQFKQLVAKKAGISWEIYLKPRAENMKTSASAEVKWAFALALLSTDDFAQFIKEIQVVHSNMSLTARSRSKSMLKKISICASMVDGRNIFCD